MNVASFFDELLKLGAISDEQAQASAERLEGLEKTRPTAGQVARYGALGVGAGAAGRLVSHGIEHSKLPALRGVAGAGAAGAIGMGAMPLIRSHLDRRSEAGKLRKYLQQEHVGQYGKNPEPSTDAQTPTGLSRSAPTVSTG